MTRRLFVLLAIVSGPGHALVLHLGGKGSYIVVPYCTCHLELSNESCYMWGTDASDVDVG